MASSLNSNSTFDEITAEYINNASYVEDNSTAKARSFITAVKILLLKRPSSMTKGSNQLNFNLEVLKQELDKAEQWLEARDVDANPGPMVTRPSFKNFRG